MSALYHFTCDHGRAGIGDSGLCTPNDKMPEGHRFAWFTDLDIPVRDALGLTSTVISCDRTAHRYRVTDTIDVRRWTDVRRTIPRAFRDALEAAPGAMPAHWWISERPVPVVLDPIVRAAA